MAQIDVSRILETQRAIPGSFLEESAAVWCVLLQAQHETWKWQGLSAGDYLEIGVLHGKSASVLAEFSRAYGNRLTIVDPVIHEKTRQTLDRLAPSVNYIASPSEMLRHSGFHSENIRSIAFAHIDGMHRVAAVLSDLRTCEELLANYGILSIDDFHTDLFPQIPAATYKYLFSGMSDLSIFLVGLNKAYLCRNAAKKHYMEFARRRLLPALEQMGFKLTLAKTDRNDIFDAFAITWFYENRIYGSEHD